VDPQALKRMGTGVHGKVQSTISHFFKEETCGPLLKEEFVKGPPAGARKGGEFKGHPGEQPIPKIKDTGACYQPPKDPPQQRDPCTLYRKRDHGRGQGISLHMGD